MLKSARWSRRIATAGSSGAAASEEGAGGVGHWAWLGFTLAAGDPTSVVLSLTASGQSAGLPTRTGLHALRRLYASLLIRHGESAKTVRKRLGHSSAAITLDTYAHL